MGRVWEGRKLEGKREGWEGDGRGRGLEGKRREFICMGLRR